MKGFARRMLERALARTDYVLKDRAAPPQGLPHYVKYLRERGFSPTTVLDVGVGYGTPWLYEGFPSARFELFEPLDTFVSAMTRICEKYDAKYHLCALGAAPGETIIEIDPDVPTGSTMAGRSSALSLINHFGSEPKLVHKPIEVRQLDEFGPFPGPILLKLDVEGFEGEVLQGARTTLTSTDIIISEVSVTQRHQNEMSFGAFMGYMEALGFALIDLPELSAIHRKGPLGYVDAVFARSDGSLRR